MNSKVLNNVPVFNRGRQCSEWSVGALLGWTIIKLTEITFFLLDEVDICQIR